MATLRELSEITGYSIATISRVLNEDATLNVTDSTRRMILEAAGKIDYSCKHGNSKRNFGAHRRIGIVEMDNIQNAERDPYYLYLKSNAEKCCFNNGIETVMMQYDINSKYYRSAVPKALDGILAIGQFQEDKIAAMRKCTSKIVFLDSAPYPEEFCSVIPDYEVGIRQGMDYLIEQGHRKIAFIGPEFSTDSTGRQALESRRRFFSDYLENCEEEVQGVLIDTVWQEDDVAERLAEYFSSLKDKDAKVTAFFAFSETTAMGVLQALQLMGHQVPEDFSILSYNDTILATLTQPRLSGICINIEEMVKNAVWLLERVTKNEKAVPLKISVPCVLHIRESVKPVYPF